MLSSPKLRLTSHAFPPTPDDLIRVLDPGSAEEARQDPAAITVLYPRSVYALGVATRICAVNRPPTAAVEGQLGIYLDLETITQLARELTVDPESLIAVVAVHELAHCRRGHADSGMSSATHGWLEEGDAQRDAWQVLTEFLADETWSGVAYEARAAQLRLASRQPPAYRQFAAGGAEWASIDTTVAVPERQTWLLEPVRRVFRLVHEGNVELPAFRASDGEIAPFS